MNSTKPYNKKKIFAKLKKLHFQCICVFKKKKEKMHKKTCPQILLRGAKPEPLQNEQNMRRLSHEHPSNR